MANKSYKKNNSILENESGAFVYPPGTRQGFALLYPNSYKAGMSNLGFHIIYRQINLRSDTACERFFLPTDKDRELLSVENSRKLADFTVIGAMMSFEPDYFNLLSMLEMGKVTLLASERKEKDPIVILGGPCATFNPEPLAAFAEVCVIGEGEEVVGNILDSLYSNSNLPRAEKLKSLAQIPGVYVPKFYTPVYSNEGKLSGIKTPDDVPGRISRQWIKDIDKYPGYYQIITQNTEFSSMFVIEVARGCGRHCRFCMAGYCFRPPRQRNLEVLWQDISQRPTASKKVGLLGASVCDYPDIEVLTQKLAEGKIPFSLSSLRADRLNRDFVRRLVQSGLKSLTVAPEAGSQRLRQVINKGIEEEDILRAVAYAHEEGISNIRLYFMVGLPTETIDDIYAIEELVLKAQAQSKKGRVTLSINPFVPKPFTPFQWDSMIDEKTFAQRINYLKNVFKNQKNIDMKVESYKSSLVQAALSCGERKTGELLLEAYKKGGSKEFARLIKKEHGLPCYKTQDYLPWEHLHMGFEKEYLLQEREKALKEAQTAMCFAGCLRCGVCEGEL